MKIIAISDLHGHLPQLPEADIICIVGDITSDDHRKDAAAQWRWYNEVYLSWVDKLSARKVITVAGNHDYCFLEYSPISTDKHIYLENTGVEIDGYTFYGTPNTRPPMNNFAFSEKSEELTRIFNKIPDKLDFLLCHAAPYGVNDCGTIDYKEPNYEHGVHNFSRCCGVPYVDEGDDIGNKELTDAIRYKDIRYVFCGHVHTGNHAMDEWQGKKIANVSYCKESKIPAYEPLILEI